MWFLALSFAYFHMFVLVWWLISKSLDIGKHKTACCLDLEWPYNAELKSKDFWKGSKLQTKHQDPIKRKIWFFSQLTAIILALRNWSLLKTFILFYVYEFFACMYVYHVCDWCMGGWRCQIPLEPEYRYLWAALWCWEINVNPW